MAKVIALPELLVNVVVDFVTRAIKNCDLKNENQIRNKVCNFVQRYSTYTTNVSSASRFLMSEAVLALCICYIGFCAVIGRIESG